MAEEEAEDLEWEEWKPEKISFVHHMIAGSCAGLAEHVSIFPLDTLKTHIQCERCGSTSPLQTWNCATRIVGREGIFRLWRGVSAMFAGCVPAHAAYFSIFEGMKVLLGADQAGHRPLQAAGCGATAAFAHDMCMTPFDTVKQRMQLGHYKNVVHCVRTVAAQEGIRAFYLSLPTTLTMNLPYGMIMVAVNESARKALSSIPSSSSKTNQQQQQQQQVSITTSMMAGSIAGAVAAAMTNPLDVIKTRLQTQNLEPCPRVNANSHVVIHHVSNASGGATANPILGEFTSSLGTSRSALEVAKQIYAENGAMGFMRGAFPRILLHTPAVAISWTAYEVAKNFLHGLK